MRRILVITLGSLSSGEFTIANEFCKKLPIDKYEVVFLTSAKGVAYLEQENFRHHILDAAETNSMLETKQKNRQKAQIVLDEFRPDYILISDIYTMWYSVSWSGIDIGMLKASGALVGSIDSYQFQDTTYIQDYYGGYVARLPKLIEECDFVVRYCPINKYFEQNNKVKCTYLFDVDAMHVQEKIEFKKEYQVADNEKVVFMTTSNWESLNINRLPALTNLLHWIPRIIVESLKELKTPIRIIHVGPQPLEVSYKDTTVSYHHQKFIEPKRYNICLKYSDLFITTNIISTTLALAVYYNTPAIVLQNNKYLDFSKMSTVLKKMPSWYLQMAEDVKVAFPFRLFPFGWYEFLKPLLKENPYCSTFVQVNLFKKNQLVKALKDYLYNEDKISELKRRQSNYISDILKLPSPDEVLESLISDHTLEKTLLQSCHIHEKFNERSQKRYQISMKNIYLNKEGNTYRIQNLTSEYIRRIRDVVPNILAFTNYEWKLMRYTEQLPKKKLKSIDWTFVKGKSFDSHILLNDIADYKENDETVIAATYEGSFQSIEQSYADLPPLPTVYLVIMQTFDIITFENFVSYLYIRSRNYGGFHINKWIKIKPSELEHGTGAQIGMGKYATSSSFKNSIFNVRFLGYTICKSKVCWVFDYYCDASKVYMEDKAGKNGRKGISYYHGQIYLDKESGDLVNATMEENYIANQTGSVNKNIIIKRRVFCEVLD